jgi:hypothetical protein
MGVKLQICNRIFNVRERGSSNLVSIVNSFCSLKEFCLLLTVSLDEQHNLCAESPLSSERENTVALVREGLI